MKMKHCLLSCCRSRSGRMGGETLDSNVLILSHIKGLYLFFQCRSVFSLLIILKGNHWVWKKKNSIEVLLISKMIHFDQWIRGLFTSQDLRKTFTRETKSTASPPMRQSFVQAQKGLRLRSDGNSKGLRSSVLHRRTVSKRWWVYSFRRYCLWLTPGTGRRLALAKYKPRIWFWVLTGEKSPHRRYSRLNCVVEAELFFGVLVDSGRTADLILSEDWLGCFLSLLPTLQCVISRTTVPSERKWGIRDGKKKPGAYFSFPPFLCFLFFPPFCFSFLELGLRWEEFCLVRGNLKWLASKCLSQKVLRLAFLFYFIFFY